MATQLRMRRNLADSSSRMGPRRLINCNIGIPYTSAAIGLHAECADPPAHTIITQCSEKHPHAWMLAPIVNDKKIVVFRRNRQKAETVQLCYGFNGEIPSRRAPEQLRRTAV